MHISILSDTRVPTRPLGGHGLGRVAWDVAAALARGGHVVTLYAGFGSTAPPGVTLHCHPNEVTRAQGLAQRSSPACSSPRAKGRAKGEPGDGVDAWLDFSHLHTLSQIAPEAPIVNYISDSECPYAPPNAVVCTQADQRRYPSAVRVSLGIDMTRIPLYLGGRDADPYLAFVAKIIAHKGVDRALLIHQRASVPVRFAGERLMPLPLPDYRGDLEGGAVYDFMGRARGVLQLARIGAGGGRIQLEAAACGTPTLCLDAYGDPDLGDGVQEHVEHGLSGFVCADLGDLIDAVRDLPALRPRPMREWVEATHGLDLMALELARLLARAADGERW